MRVTRPAQPRQHAELAPDRPPVQNWRAGWLFRPGSLWIGVHCSAYNKRLCINLLPCVTVWVVMPGGFAP
ncbi:MAG: hypothetical protein M0R33_07205 [Methylomonas sp.]|uniref:hypothetical protein n=1 Tax=Methylomonas sp. TaxID=418 RepID=UPI0025FA79F9|nr:hypothetical protein [Methylomonas sp.]MCK9606225.1 hypothetical protein [Methylomonas sp.]